jgi:hypothetical protein
MLSNLEDKKVAIAILRILRSRKYQANDALDQDLVKALNYYLDKEKVEERKHFLPVVESLLMTLEKRKALDSVGRMRECLFFYPKDYLQMVVLEHLSQSKKEGDQKIIQEFFSLPHV